MLSLILHIVPVVVTSLYESLVHVPTPGVKLTNISMIMMIYLLPTCDTVAFKAAGAGLLLMSLVKAFLAAETFHLFLFW